MGEFTQDDRFFSIETPLGKDELLLTHLEGSEYISRLFKFELATLSSNLAIKPEDLVGKQVTRQQGIVSRILSSRHEDNEHICRDDGNEWRSPNRRGRGRGEGGGD